MPSALFNSFKIETNKKLINLYIIGYICVFAVCAGALFKIQHWPYANLILIISIPVPFVLFLPVYIWSIRKNKELNYNNLILILFFFAYFAGITSLLALNVSKNLLDEYVISANNYEEQYKLTTLQTSDLINSLNNLKPEDSIKNQSIQLINHKTELITRLIDNIKKGILKNVDDNDLAIDSAGNYNLWKIKGADNKTIYQNPVFIDKIDELKNSIKDYNKLLLSYINSNDAELKACINHMTCLPDNWQNSRFGGKYVIEIIDALNSIKLSLGLAELQTIISLN